MSTGLDFTLDSAKLNELKKASKKTTALLEKLEKVAKFGNGKYAVMFDDDIYEYFEKLGEKKKVESDVLIEHVLREYMIEHGTE